MQEKASGQSIDNSVAEQGAASQALHLMTRAVEQANSKVAVLPPPILDHSNSMLIIYDFFFHYLNLALWQCMVLSHAPGY